MKEVLMDSEEKYRNLLENARDTIMTLDLNGNITFVNRVVEEYGFKIDEILGKNMTEFVPEKYQPKLIKEFAKVIQGKTAEGEIELITPKGKIISEYRSSPIRRGNKVIGSQTILRDISERKKAEEALRESKERYKELTESITDVFFAMDKNLRYTYWNRASEKLTGISAEDAIGKSLTEVFPDVKGTRVEQFYLDTLRTQQSQSFVNEYRLGDKDFVFEINAYPTRDGLSVFVKDITERKRMEEALTASEEKFRNIFGSANDSMIYLDSSGRILDVNRKAVELYGGSKEELLGKHFTMLGEISPNYMPTIISNFAKTLVGEKTYIDICMKNRKGQEMHFEASASLVKGKSEPVAVLCIARDVTERKRAEEALRNSEGKVWKFS